MISTIKSPAVKESTEIARQQRLLPALGIAAIGGLLVLITAFAPLPVVHNAAHDGRHSFAVPCH